MPRLPGFPPGSRRVLMGTNHGAVHIVKFPVHLPLNVGLLLYCPQQTIPQAILAPAIEPAGYRAPGAVALRQVSPRSSGAQHPENAINDGAMVLSWPTSSRLLGRQQGL